MESQALFDKPGSVVDPAGADNGAGAMIRIINFVLWPVDWAVDVIADARMSARLPKG